MPKTDRIPFRITPEQKARLVAYAEAHPGTMADHIRVAISRYLDAPTADRLVYAVIDPGGRTLRLFGTRARAEGFVEGLGAHLEPSGEWWYDDDGEPSESGEIRPQEVE